MHRSLFVLVIAALISIDSHSQARLRKLPTTINHPAINVASPFISLDGNTLIFISDNADDNALTMNFTIKADGVNWKEPVMMAKNVNNRLNFTKGYALSADGKMLLLTNLKGGGLGGFDLFTSELRGTNWTEPVNLGLPVNTVGHEGCPSLSADGSTLYFMRCDKMDQKKAEGCKLFVAKKQSSGKWGTPEELPSSINTGNSQTPRIMGDGETLIFSSDRFPQGKGGMDLYMTRFSGSQWSQPVALDFANTPQEDQFVSATSLGRYLMKDAPGQRKNEIVELLFPAELKPKGMMKVDGSIRGNDAPSAAYITVFNQRDQSRVFNGRPVADGTFTVYLKEGGVYDLSVEPEKDSYSYYSKSYDLTVENFPISEKIDATIKPMISGDVIETSISFQPRTAEFTENSAQELRRLVRLMKGNAGKKFNVNVTLIGYLQDSIKSDPDLTEVITDTLHFPVVKQIVLGTDSLGMDSLTNVTFDSVVVKHTYHNDRTLQQAKSIVKYLVDAGIPDSDLTISHRVVAEAIPENRKRRISVSLR